MTDPMTPAERDAAIAALERVRNEMGKHVVRQSHMGPCRVIKLMVPVDSLTEVIDAEIARLRGEGEHG